MGAEERGAHEHGQDRSHCSGNTMSGHVRGVVPQHLEWLCRGNNPGTHGHTSVTPTTLHKLSALYQQAYSSPEHGGSGSGFEGDELAGGLERRGRQERCMRAALPWLLAPRLLADMKLSQFRP
jgi:hypothetical protein